MGVQMMLNLVSDYRGFIDYLQIWPCALCVVEMKIKQEFDGGLSNCWLLLRNSKIWHIIMDCAFMTNFVSYN